MSKFLLKLTRLDFISPVDSPAQETAKVLLIKRKGEIDGSANVVKISDELGLVFCWAFTSKSAGADYYDLHGDTIDPDFVAAAASFMERGGVTDEMHDGSPDGRVVFAMPMTPEIAKAFSIETDTVGLMIALKPSPEVFAKFKSGEYTGVSIQGMGERVEARKSITVPVEIDAVAAHAVLDELLVKARALEAALGKSTRPAEVRTTGVTMQLDEALTEIETLKAKLADSERRASLTDAERNEEIEKSNPIVHTAEDGTVYRKSDDSRLVEMSKKMDESIKIAKAEAAAREQVEVEKRAEAVFSKVAGKRSTHAAILKAVEGLGDTEALQALQSMANLANERMTLAETPAGINPGTDAAIENPQAEYDALVVEAAKSHSGDRFKAAASVLKTAKGMQLYAAITKRSKRK